MSAIFIPAKLRVGYQNRQGCYTGKLAYVIYNRINKLSLSAKRKELEALEARLDKLVSPELKAKMELELIEKELGL